MAKGEKILVVVPKWLKDSAREAAESKGVSMSEFIRDAMKDAVKTHQQQTEGSKP